MEQHLHKTESNDLPKLPVNQEPESEIKNSHEQAEDPQQLLEHEAERLEKQAAEEADNLLALVAVHEAADGKKFDIIRAQIEKTRDQFTKSVRNLSYAAALGTILLSSLLKDKPSANETPEDMRDRAKKEMTENGITWEQRQAHIFGVNDLIYRGIAPLNVAPNDYAASARFAKDSFTQFIKGRKSAYQAPDKGFGKFAATGRGQFEDNPGEEDAWRLYLGIPQEYKTLAISEYTPQNSKEKKYYYKFTDFVKEMQIFSERDYELLPIEMRGDTQEVKNKVLQNFIRSVVIGTKSGKKLNREIQGAGSSPTMHDFQWSQGQDQKGPYIAYYDIYNLDVPLEREKGFIGKAFEIYDRIYYNPVTFEPVQ